MMVFSGVVRSDLGAHCEIAIVGGAVVVLLYGARQATKDVDAFMLSLRRAGDCQIQALVGLPLLLTCQINRGFRAPS
jgi:hypothetical protein